MNRSIALKIFIGAVFIFPFHTIPAAAQSESTIQMEYLGAAKGMRNMRPFEGGGKIPKKVDESPLLFEWTEKYYVALEALKEGEDKPKNMHIKFVHATPDKESDPVNITLTLLSPSQKEWIAELPPINVRKVDEVSLEDLYDAGLKEFVSNQFSEYYKTVKAADLQETDRAAVSDQLAKMIAKSLNTQKDQVTEMREYAAGKPREVAMNVMDMGLKGRKRRQAEKMQRTMDEVLAHSMKADNQAVRKVNNIDDIDMDSIKYTRTLKEGDDETVYEILTGTERIQVNKSIYEEIKERRKIP